MEDMIYWIIEYGKVFIGFGFLMFLWPMVIFRKYLAGKGATFRFAFCITAQVMIVNTVVLFLGLLHILNDWTLRLVFYGGFLFSIRQCFALTVERKKKFRYLVNGSFGLKNFCQLEFRKYVRILEEFIKRVWAFYKKHWLEYSLLVVAVVYGVTYFSWGVFHDRSYGFSDMNVHHQWIYQLSEGNIFYAGIYPQGMHCVIYAMNALFGIKLYSVMLFIPSVNMILILLALYCLMKEVFHCRFSAILSLGFFLIFGGIGRNVMIGMARMQCALPQEFAFPAVILCCLYLLRYLKGGHYAVIKEKKTKGYWDENLLIFMLAFAATIAIHFYATIMAFFICLGVAVFLWKKIFTKERFLPLISAVLVGLFIAILPMFLGYVSGIKLQGSLYWAMSVMQGGSENEESDQNSMTEENIQDDVEKDGLQGTTTDASGVLDGTGQITDEESKNFEQTKPSFWNRVITRVRETGNLVWYKIKTIGTTMYKEGQKGICNEQFAKCLLVIFGSVIIWGLLRKIGCIAIEKLGHRKIRTVNLSGYFMILTMLVVYVICYIPRELGLPSIIEQSRIGVMYMVVVSMTVIIPIDYLLAVLGKKLPSLIMKGASLSALAGVIGLVISNGWYHSYLYFELTRYDSVVQVVTEIIDNMPELSYTIVSPTEELYQVIEYGWHEELIDFVLNQENDSYVIPTKYVFLLLEKRPLQHAQYHFHDGPRWLAENNYRNIYGNHSVYPEYLSSEISEEAAQKTAYRIGSGYDSYRNLSMRTIIESKAFEWCETFDKNYPNELKVYYEDEHVICYYWQQNPSRLYNLSIK